MKILHLVGRLRLGGTEKWLATLIHAWPDPGDRFVLAVFDTGDSERFFQIANANPTVCCIRGPRDVFGAAVDLYRLVRQHRIDVIHSHVHFYSGVAMIVGALAGVPVRVAHAHTARPDDERATYRWLMRTAISACSTAGLAASAPAAAALFGTGWRDDARWRVSHCGIDMEHSRNQPAQVFNGGEQRTKLPDGAFTLGYIGRFAEEKNLDVVVGVADELRQRGVALNVLMVGDGPERSRIESRACRMDLCDRFTFTGTVTDVTPWLAKMDVLILPSRFEGLPVTILESQWAVVPAVISDAVTSEVVCCKELVRFVSRDADIKTWADAILSVLSSCRPGTEYVRKVMRDSDFNIDTSARMLRALYLT